MIPIHVYGDSHSRNILGQISHLSSPQVISHEKFCFIDNVHSRKDGATICGLMNEKSRTGLNLFIREDIDKNNPQNIALVLGEVDVRFLLAKDKGSVANTISRYEKFVQSLTVPGKIILWGGIPYTEKAIIEDKLQRHKELYLELEENIANMAVKNGWHCIKTAGSVLVDENNHLKLKYWTSPDQLNNEHHLNPQTVLEDLTLPVLREIFKEEISSYEEKTL